MTFTLSRIIRAIAGLSLLSLAACGTAGPSASPPPEYTGNVEAIPEEGILEVYFATNSFPKVKELFLNFGARGSFRPRKRGLFERADDPFRVVNICKVLIVDINGDPVDKTMCNKKAGIVGFLPPKGGVVAFIFNESEVKRLHRHWRKGWRVEAYFKPAFLCGGTVYEQARWHGAILTINHYGDEQEFTMNPARIRACN